MIHSADTAARNGALHSKRMLTRFGAALIATLAVVSLRLPALAQAPSPSPTAPTAPSPSPSPSPTPTPPLILGGSFTIFGFHTNGVNNTGALDTRAGADRAGRSDISDLLLNLSAGDARFRVTASAGVYNLLTVGTAINPTSQAAANTLLYSQLPVAAAQYNFNSHFSLAAGKFASLLGQESPFTYQNINVQRGLAWAIEPTISRGVRAIYTNGPWSATVEANDAYYSGRNRAIEWLLGYAPNANTNIQFAGIVPGVNVGSNPTVTVGNKAEYDLMLTQQVGKLQLLPYILWVHSPASAPLGYMRDENATAAVLMGTYTWSSPFSLAFRWESVWNNSSTGDTSGNADLVGYGPGSSARSITLTPTYHFAGYGVLRLEYSHVWISSFTPGLGFEIGGTGGNQDRFGFELGVVH
ncbi:MAG: outer membrane beta-barrel protein [Candidatus Eremiobacteraeota bacterium]|nr:outer membrane beta-barrel protein [Candidatus Eremiobacteraeota bacterium]